MNQAEWSWLFALAASYCVKLDSNRLVCPEPYATLFRPYHKIDYVANEQSESIEKTTVISMKLKLVSLLRNSPSFMKTEGLFPCSHKPGIKTYPELKESNARFGTSKSPTHGIVYTTVE
jgi:hypothetical protein